MGALLRRPATLPLVHFLHADRRLPELPSAPCRLHRVQSTGAYPGTRPAIGLSNLSEAPYPTAIL